MSDNNQNWQRAQQVIPGGVNSPVRSFNGVGKTPIFIERSEGPYVYGSDGKQYIDYIGAWGPMILGHNNPQVLQAVKNAAEKGMSFGAPTALETEMAELVCKLVPSIEQVRMVNSGTEATMSAIRLARAHTKRDKIIKFEGCYHGHSDAFLVKAGSGALTLGVPTSPGVPSSVAEDTLTANYNDLDNVKALFSEYKNEIAAVIVEPIAGNMNLVIPEKSFLQGLRDLCDEHDSVLIFDEVMTGFRVALGGAQEYFNILPDLTTLGKVIGGGLPVGAFGGRKEVMQRLAPAGSVYQAGTLSGSPLAMAAGLANLQGIQAADFFTNLSNKAKKLTEGIEQAAKEQNIPMCTQQVGGMFGLFFTEKTSVTSFTQVMSCNQQQFKQFFHAMLEEGIMLAPSAFEAGFISAAHEDAHIQQTIFATQKALSRLHEKVHTT